MINFMSLEAVLWDMDGVLLDSSQQHLESWKRMFQTYGQTIKPGEMMRAFGMTNDQVIQSLTDEDIPKKQADRMAKEKDAIFQELIRTQAQFLPGVPRWLQIFQRNGLYQVLASSGSPGNIDTILDSLQARRYFDAIVSGDQLPSKPAPDVFVLAAHKAGVVPLHCIVIEDSVAGVQAAKAAGMKCVAVTTTYPSLKLNDADLVIENLACMRMEDIKRLWQ